MAYVTVEKNQEGQMVGKNIMMMRGITILLTTRTPNGTFSQEILLGW